MEATEMTTRDRLILAGMSELRKYGMEGFSLRRVAASCGVSCAAPYKHFTNRQDFFRAMADYIYRKWDERVKAKLVLIKPVEHIIAEFAADHVEFLCQNPDFKSVLLIKETGLDSPLAARATTISVALARLFVIYRRKYDLSREQLRMKIFIVRSVMYGSSIIMNVDDQDIESRLAVIRAAVLNTLKTSSQN